MAALTRTLQTLKERFESPERLFRTVGGVFFGTEGDKENTVPDRATFTIDRRIPPNETLAQAEAELRQALEDAQKTVRDLRFEVARTLSIEPCLTDPSHSFVQEFARVVRSVRRRPVRFGITSGFTESSLSRGKWIASRRGIRTFGRRGSRRQ